MKRLILVTGFVAIAVGLSGCIVVQAPQPAPPSAAPTSPVIDAQSCVSSDLRITESGSYQLDGPCGSVTVEGTDITIAAPDIERLVIRGDRITVVGGSLDSVAISGTENTVTGSDFGTVSINGDRNQAKAETIRSLRIDGNDNTVSGPVAGDVDQSGDRNEVNQ